MANQLTDGSAPGADVVPKFRGARRNTGIFSVSLSRADAADVRERIKALGLDGPSEFFRRLISEGRGARLPVLL